MQTADTCIAIQRGSNGQVADAKVSNRQPDKRFGDDPVASISNANGQQEQLLLRFDTSGIPRHASITSATLTLWQTNSGRSTSLRAHAVTHPWQEASITWNGFASAHAPDVAASLDAPGPTHPAARTLDVSGLVSSWVRQPESNHGLLLAQPEGKTLLDTSESPHPQRRPRLEVCYSIAPMGTEPSGTSLLLQVVDASGQPVPGAVVSSKQALFPTDSSGHLLLENLQPGRFLARVDALGFTSASVVVELHEGAHAGYQVKLLPVGEPIPFRAEEGGVIETPSVRVSIPANAVVDSLGQPVTGTVEVTVAPLDPTTQLAAMPGPLEGTSAVGGEPVQLESFFMAEVSLWSQGTPVQLASGASATLEFVLPDVLASQFQPGDTVPAWWFDLDAGLWRQEGQGTIQDSATQPGKRVWVAQVKHFTWWNCDAPLTDKSCIDVLVVDDQGRPQPMMQVHAEGVSYTGYTIPSYTGASGRTCVEIKRGHTANVFAGVRNMSATAQVTGTQQAASCGNGFCTTLTLQLMKERICTPGAYAVCAYSGPAGTVGKGMCRAGRRRCSIDGTEWSACEGEALPIAETCRSPFDDDCDGVVNEDCSCSEQEGLSCYTGPSRTQGVGICSGGTVGCDLFGNMTCVDQQLPRTEVCSTLEDDDCDGSNECTPLTQWFWRPNYPLSCTGSGEVRDVAMDGEDNALVLGHINGTLDFGGISLTGSDDHFVAKFDASGQPVWSLLISDGSPWMDTLSMTVDRAGNVLVAGVFEGTLRIGGLALANASQPRPFVAKLSPSGSLLWVRSFESTVSYISLSGLATDSAGNIALTGDFREGTLRIGSIEHATGHPYAIYVAKLEGSTGEPLWSRSFGCWNFLNAWDAAMDDTGNVLVAGSFSNTLDIDGMLLTTLGDRPDVFVAKFDSSTGSTRWSQSTSQEPTIDFYASLAVDRAGNALVVAGVIPSRFRLTKLDPNGQMLWSKTRGYDDYYYDSLDFETLDLTSDASGNVLLSGSFQGGMDFGGGGRSSHFAHPAAFLAWYDANGGYLADDYYPILEPELYYPMGESRGGGAAINSAGNVLLGGTFSGAVDFGAGPVVATCDDTPFLMKVDPTP